MQSLYIMINQQVFHSYRQKKKKEENIIQFIRINLFQDEFVIKLLSYAGQNMKAGFLF